jgi:hypothetical protein
VPQAVIILMLNWQEGKGSMSQAKLSREEMITLVRKIMREEWAEGTGAEREAERDADIDLFRANCLHPGGANLIFWPHGHPHDPTKPEPTAEEIVDKAMSQSGVIRL